MKFKTQSIIVLVYFVISRIIFSISGINILIDYSYMHFHDIGLLNAKFWESILYTHAFTPWINILTGFVFLFPQESHNTIYTLIFYSMSIIALIGFLRILNRLKLPAYLALFIVIFYSLSPAYIYFEHFLSYTFPSMTMLLILVNAFDIALTKKKFKWWLLFFSCCVLLTFIRTTFHYVWLITALIGVFILLKRIDKKVIIAFMIPVSLLTLWYVKNLIYFGFFGASSWSGFNLAFVTTKTLAIEEKEKMVADSTFSPLVLKPIYSQIEDYNNYVNLEDRTGIEVLDNTKKGTSNQTNFNHKGFIQLSALKMKDNITFIKKYPSRYIKTILKGHRQYFGPSTRWHPHDEKSSPHIPIRNKIGFWENAYNTIFHSLPINEMGIYTLIFMIYIFLFLKYLVQTVKGKTFDEKDRIMIFLVMNTFYVTTLSCLVSYGELARYRFMIEPFIWAFSIHFIIKSKVFKRVINIVYKKNSLVND